MTEDEALFIVRKVTSETKAAVAAMAVRLADDIAKGKAPDAGGWATLMAFAKTLDPSAYQIKDNGK